MIVHTKFSIGDRVIPVYRAHEQVTRDCSRCGGKGELALAEGGTVPCTNRFAWKESCNAGKVTLGHLSPWKIETESVGAVGQVQVKRTTHHIADSWNDNNANKYMLHSTGVGSGRVWNEDDLFATVEEAQGACDRRNAVVLDEERDNINAGQSRRTMDDNFAAETAEPEPVAS